MPLSPSVSLESSAAETHDAVLQALKDKMRLEGQLEALSLEASQVTDTGGREGATASGRMCAACGLGAQSSVSSPFVRLRGSVSPCMSVLTLGCGPDGPVGGSHRKRHW